MRSVLNGPHADQRGGREGVYRGYSGGKQCGVALPSGRSACEQAEDGCRRAMSWTARHQQQHRGAFICGQMARRIAICESHASCAPLSSTLIVCTHANEHRSSAGSPIPRCADRTPKHPRKQVRPDPPRWTARGMEHTGAWQCGGETPHGDASCISGGPAWKHGAGGAAGTNNPPTGPTARPSFRLRQTGSGAADSIPRQPRRTLACL